MTTTPDDPDTQYDDETDVPGGGEPAPESDAPAEPGSDDAAEAVDDVELEDDDVAVPGSPEFDEDHQLLTGKDADLQPGAAAG